MKKIITVTRARQGEDLHGPFSALNTVTHRGGGNSCPKYLVKSQI